MKHVPFRKALMALSLVLLLGGSVVLAETSIPNPTVLLETSMGPIKIELFPKEAPGTVKNFLTYVKEGFYQGTLFHRVIPGFMIQGGGFWADLKEKPTGPLIKNEAANGLKNDRGTVAMARTADPDSATAQFFINLNDNDRLNRPLPDGHGYAVFGRVIEGMAVVDRIAMVKTGAQGIFRDVPITPVVITLVRVLP
jgi:peptidyl-prolyl cis-trans isomerase A (cyclophilin A)